MTQETTIETASPAEQTGAPVEPIATESTPVETEVSAQNSPTLDSVQKRIDELTREKYEARREAQLARQEAEAIRRHIEQQQQDPNAPLDPARIQAFVQQEAARQLHESQFNAACNKVHDEGSKSISGFDNSLANLHHVGVSREFLEVLVESDQAAKIIHHLGTNLDEAARIVSLPPVRMAREITKLEAKLADQPKQISNAPEPIKPIGGKSVNSLELRDGMSYKDFKRVREAQIKASRGR